MKIFEVFRKFAFAGLLAIACVLSGCQQPSRAVFNESIRQSVDSVQAGDMETADIHLAEARKNAKSHEDKRIVQSIDDLVTGAKAMMAGDVAGAKQQWADIDDPHFNREVRIKANVMMGVRVPLVAQVKEPKK
ncbi:MAG: hypothetical protein FVQ82_08820 [Planctomycetes bacterium]|nr:hypothetical protein [Planctomycetota bacterium]